MRAFVFALIILSMLVIAGCTQISDGCYYNEEKASCCKGSVCASGFVDCLEGTSPEFIGCSDACIPEYRCEPGVIEKQDISDCVRAEMEKTKDKPEIVKDQIIAHYGDLMTREQAIELMNSYDLEILYAYESIPSIVVKVPEQSSYETLCRLRQEPTVKAADFDRLGSGL